MNFRDPKKEHKLRKRHRFSVKGPGRVWSADGYDKLSQYGFEIYGFIDAFSRFTTGVYVGITNRTQVAVLKYYLDCVRRLGFPLVLRTDKGGETSLMCAAHVALRRVDEPDLAFKKAYVYGPSTRNQRIEAWWNTLADGLAETWRRFFGSLAETHLFESDSAADVTALRFIYMEKLREQVANFVEVLIYMEKLREQVANFLEVHNIHPIRRQKARAAYHRHGKPEELFYFPKNTPRYHQMPSDRHEPLLQHLESLVQNYDILEYQEQQVRDLCKHLLIAGDVTYDIDVDFDSGLEATHVQAYKFLRSALRELETEIGQPIPLLQPPLGGQAWIDRMAQEAEAQRGEAIRIEQYLDQLDQDDAVSDVAVSEVDSDGSGVEDQDIGGDQDDDEGALFDGL